MAASSVCTLPVVGEVCGAVTSAAGTVAGGILGDMAKAAVDAETEVLKMLSAAFLSVPTPDLTSNGSAVAFIQQSLVWLMVAVAVVSLIIAGGRVAWSRKGQPAAEALRRDRPPGARGRRRRGRDRPAHRSRRRLLDVDHRPEHEQPRQVAHDPRRS